MASFLGYRWRRPDARVPARKAHEVVREAIPSRRASSHAQQLRWFSSAAGGDWVDVSRFRWGAGGGTFSQLSFASSQSFSMRLPSIPHLRWCEEGGRKDKERGRKEEQVGREDKMCVSRGGRRGAAGVGRRVSDLDRACATSWLKFLSQASKLVTVTSWERQSESRGTGKEGGEDEEAKQERATRVGRKEERA